MALDNLISVSFTEAELKSLDDAMTAIEAVLVGKTVNLTPEERQQYGSIADQNKILVDKARMYMQQKPQFVPPFIDVPEFERDYAARTQIESRLKRLASIAEQFDDTKVLLDSDNYNNSLTFYRNIRYLAGENAPGAGAIYDDLKQHFGGRPSTKTTESTEA